MRTTTYVLRGFTPRLRTIIDGHEREVTFIETDPVVWQLWCMSQVIGIVEVSTQSTTTFITVEHGREKQILDFLRLEFRATEARPLRAGAPHLLAGKIYHNGESELEMTDFVESLLDRLGDVVGKINSASLPVYELQRSKNRSVPISMAEDRQRKLDDAHVAVRNLQRFVGEFREIMGI